MTKLLSWYTYFNLSVIIIILNFACIRVNLQIFTISAKNSNGKTLIFIILIETLFILTISTRQTRYNLT